MRPRECQEGSMGINMCQEGVGRSLGAKMDEEGLRMVKKKGIKRG